MLPLEKKAVIKVNPNRDFIRSLNFSADKSLKRCIQCGTCSAVCSLSPPNSPFPRKEMAMAGLGMKKELLCDPDVWLCYQCNECSRSCPRRARPGDVMAAIRKETIVHYASPRFLARWIEQPRSLPFLFVVPAVMLWLTISYRDRLAEVLDIQQCLGNKIVYSHSFFLPHWLLIFFFSILVLFVLSVTTISAFHFWQSMKDRAIARGEYKKARSISSCITFALKRILTHDNFGLCDDSRSRFLPHFCVFFGFLSLAMVAAWIIFSGWNLFSGDRFVYPFSFLSPWKILANLGGVSLLTGCSIMISDRLKKESHSKTNTYFDWYFLVILFCVVSTGFATEGLHYLRLEPHRHVVYFVHLVFVCALLMSLPYTKLAHFVYRTIAIIFVAHIGRQGEEDVHQSRRKGKHNDK